MAAIPDVKAWHQHTNRYNNKDRHPFSDYLAIRNKIYLARKHIGYQRSLYIFFYFILLSIKYIILGIAKRDDYSIKRGVWRFHGAINGLIGNMKPNRWSVPE
jgi:hypothetical protein